LASKLEAELTMFLLIQLFYSENKYKLKLTCGKENIYEHYRHLYVIKEGGII